MRSPCDGRKCSAADGGKVAESYFGSESDAYNATRICVLAMRKVDLLATLLHRYVWDRNRPHEITDFLTPEMIEPRSKGKAKLMFWKS